MVIHGAGKSTLASYLFTELKVRGFEAELVHDVAKDLVWEEDWKALNNQMYVFANQLQHLDKLVGKVEYVITDSPLLLQIGYYKERQQPAQQHFKKLCKAYAKRYNNIDIFLKSNKEVSPIGRAEMSLNPMKYLSSMPYDMITDCTHREEILQYILDRRKNE